MKLLTVLNTHAAIIIQKQSTKFAKYMVIASKHMKRGLKSVEKHDQWTVKNLLYTIYGY